jgi:hypothetical protein
LSTIHYFASSRFNPEYFVYLVESSSFIFKIYYGAVFITLLAILYSGLDATLPSWISGTIDTDGDELPARSFVALVLAIICCVYLETMAVSYAKAIVTIRDIRKHP